MQISTFVCGSLLPEGLESGAILWAFAVLAAGASLYRGLLPGLGCTAAGLLAVLAAPPRPGWLILSLFALFGVVMSLLGQRHLRVTQRLRQQLEQLERANVLIADGSRRKDEFLAMLAHELRNPLAPIQNAALILKSVGGQDPIVKEVREMIERQVRHLCQLVNELSDATRIALGKIVLERTRVDLGEVVARAVELNQADLEQRQHEFHVACPDPAPRVNGDFTRLIQVMQNLIGNAARYTPDRGQIHVHVELEDAFAVVRVRDNGIGIEAEVLPLIFELFVQVRSQRSALNGLGVGLAVVRRLVEMHDGQVSASSVGLNQGSEFVVRLPLGSG